MRAAGTRAPRSRAGRRRDERRASRTRAGRRRRNESRSRRVIIPRRRSVISRRGRRVIISRRRRGRRDVNRAGIGRVKEGSAPEIQRNAEVGGSRLDRNAQRSDRDGADEKRSSERASETTFDGSFHRGSPLKVGKRRARRFERAKRKSTKASRNGLRRGRLTYRMRRVSVSTRKSAKKVPNFSFSLKFFSSAPAKAKKNAVRPVTSRAAAFAGEIALRRSVRASSEGF